MSDIFRSRLNNLAKLKKWLNKIKDLHARKASSFVIEIEGVRLKGQDLDTVTIDPDAANDNIIIKRGPADPLEYYDLADIKLIKRIRTKKYLIKIALGADPAEVI